MDNPSQSAGDVTGPVSGPPIRGPRFHRPIVGVFFLLLALASPAAVPFAFFGGEEWAFVALLAGLLLSIFGALLVKRAWWSPFVLGLPVLALGWYGSWVWLWKDFHM